MTWYISYETRQAPRPTSSQTLKMLSGAFLSHRILNFLRMGVAAGVAGVLSHRLRQRHPDTEGELERRLALRHFQTSSLWPVPRDYQRPGWNIRNDYPGRRESQLRSLDPSDWATSIPPSGGPEDTQWSTIDFRVNPLAFCEAVKQYCWDGNVENQFVVQNNKVRLLIGGS